MATFTRPHVRFFVVKHEKDRSFSVEEQTSWEEARRKVKARSSAHAGSWLKWARTEREAGYKPVPYDASYANQTPSYAIAIGAVRPVSDKLAVYSLRMWVHGKGRLSKNILEVY